MGGALYWNDFRRLAQDAGFVDPRLVTDRPLTVRDPALAARVGRVRFYSAIYRLFKLEGLEDACEDYGQAVTYRGTVSESPDTFTLDKHHVFEAGRVHPVCGNTWRMLHETRFAPHFHFHGRFDTHYGIFAGCGATLPFDTDRSTDKAQGCCC